MWFPPKATVNWDEATTHLSRADPGLKSIIERVGPCTLKPRRDCFRALCQAIISQQISGVVAIAIAKRFRKLFPNSRPTPQYLLKLTDQHLRSVGLSRQKMAYLRDLAAHFAEGKVPVRRFSKM